MAKNSIIIKVLASILVGTFLLQDLVWANPDLSSGPAQHTTLQVQSVFNPIDQQVRLKAVVEVLLAEVVKSLPSIDTIHLLLAPKLDPPDHNLKPEFDFMCNARSAAGNRIIPCSIQDTSTGASLKLFYELVPGADGDILPREVREDDGQKSVAENAGAAVQPLAVSAIPEEYAKLEHTLGTLEGQLYSAGTMLNPKMAGKAHRLVKYIIRECDRIIDYEDRLHPKDKNRTTFHITLKAKDIRFEAILLSADIAKIRRGNFIKHTIIVIGIVAIAALLIWGGHYIADYVKSLLHWIKEQSMQNIKFSEIDGYRILLGSASVATGAAALLNSYPDATILEDGFLSEDTETTVLQLMELLKQPSDKEARIRKKVYLRCIPKTRKEYDVAACIGFQDIVSQKTIVQAIRQGVVSAIQGRASENRSHIFEIELKNPIKTNTGEVISKITFESYSPPALVAFSGAISGVSGCDTDTEKIARLIEKPFTVVPVGLPMAIVDESGITVLARYLEVDQAQLRALLITQDEIDEAINKTAATIANEKARVEAQRALEAFLIKIEGLCALNPPRYEEALAEIDKWPGRPGDVAAKKLEIALKLAEGQFLSGDLKGAAQTISKYFGIGPSDNWAVEMLKRIQAAISARAQATHNADVDAVVLKAQGFIEKESWDEAWIVMRDAKKGGLTDNRLDALQEDIRRLASASIPEWMPPEFLADFRVFMKPYEELQKKIKASQEAKEKITPKMKRDSMEGYAKIKAMVSALSDKAFAEVSVQAQTVAIRHCQAELKDFPRTMSEFVRIAKLACEEYDVDAKGNKLDPERAEKILNARLYAKAYCRALDIIYKEPYTFSPTDRRMELATAKMLVKIKMYREKPIGDEARSILVDGFMDWLSVDGVPLPYIRMSQAKLNPSFDYLKILLDLGMSPVIACVGLSTALDESRIYKKDLLLDPAGNAFIRVFFKEGFSDGAFDVTCVDIYPTDDSGNKGVTMAQAKAAMDDWPGLLAGLGASSWSAPHRRFVVDGLTYDFISQEDVRRLIDAVYPGESIMPLDRKQKLAEGKNKDEAARKSLYGKEEDDIPSQAASRLCGIANYLNRFGIDDPPTEAAIAAAKNFIVVLLDSDSNDVLRKIWADFAIKRDHFVDIDRFRRMSEAATLTVENYQEIRALCGFCISVLDHWNKMEVEKKPWYYQDIVDATTAIKEYGKGMDSYFDLELKFISYRMDAFKRMEENVAEFFQGANARAIREWRGIFNSVALSAQAVVYKDDVERLDYLESVMETTLRECRLSVRYLGPSIEKAREALTAARSRIATAPERPSEERTFIETAGKRLDDIRKYGLEIKPQAYTVTAPWSTLIGWGAAKAPRREDPSERKWYSYLWHNMIRLLVTHWCTFRYEDGREKLLVQQEVDDGRELDLGDPTNLVAFEKLGYRPGISDSALKELLSIDEAIASVAIDDSDEYPFFVITLNRADGWKIEMENYDNPQVIGRGQLRIFLFENGKPLRDVARYRSYIDANGKLLRDSPDKMPRLADTIGKNGDAKVVFVQYLRGDGMTLDILGRLGAKIDGGAKAVQAELMREMKARYIHNSDSLGFVVPRAAIWRSRKLETDGKPAEAINYLESLLKIWDECRVQRPELLINEKTRLQSIIEAREIAAARLKGLEKARAFIDMFNDLGYGKTGADEATLDRAVAVSGHQFEKATLSILHPFFVAIFAKDPAGKWLVDDKDMEQFLTKIKRDHAKVIKSIKACLPADSSAAEIANIAIALSSDLLKAITAGTAYEGKIDEFNKMMLDDVRKVPDMDMGIVGSCFGLNGTTAASIDAEINALKTQDDEHETMFWEYLIEPGDKKVSQDMWNELELITKAVLRIAELAFFYQGAVRNDARPKINAAQSDEYAKALIGAVIWQRRLKESISTIKADRIEEAKVYEMGVNARRFFEEGRLGKALEEIEAMMTICKMGLDETEIGDNPRIQKLEKLKALINKAIEAKKKAVKKAADGASTGQNMPQSVATDLLKKARKDEALQNSRLVMQFLTAISEGSSFDPAKVEKLKIAIGKERQEVSDNVEQRAFYEQVWGLITLCGLDKKNGKKEPGAGAGRIPALRWVIDRLSYKSRSISEHKDSIQVGIEQTLFWSLGLMAMRIFGNHYAALAAATWSLFILAHFVRTKNMPQAPPLNKLLTVTLINLIAFAAPYACDIPKPLFWIGMTAGFTISTYIHYKLEKSPRIVSARHSSGYTGRTAAHTASSRIERVDPATSVPSTIASTIVPIRQPEVDSVLKELASRLKPSDRFPRDIKDSEATALSIIGSLCSLMLQKKVVLVFDAGMGGVEGRKALAVIEVIRQLKRDAGSNYAKLLKNVEVITVQPHRFGEKIAPYKAQGAEIFIFAREGERALVKAITGDAVNMHAAFVSENELAPDAYYPIFEIVAATLAQYVYSIPLDDIKKALKAVNVDLTADASDGALVFRLLPPTEHYNTGELMMKYARLKEFLIKA